MLYYDKLTVSQVHFLLYVSITTDFVQFVFKFLKSDKAKGELICKNYS